MANILEFLRVLLVDGEQQRRFAADPHGYLRAHEFEHLSGEDVAEAIPVLMRNLPESLVERLGPYTAENGDAVPPVRPLVGETDLDAAVRQLTYATSLTAVDAEPEYEDEDDVAEPTGEPSRAAPEPAMAVDAQGQPGPFAALGEELAGILRSAADQIDQLMRKATERHDAVIRAAEEEAGALRSRAAEEANAILQAAKSARDEARSTLAEAHARRDEIREAERQLRERLQGVQSVLRTLEESSALPDDDRAAPQP